MVNLLTGEEERIEKVETFALSDDGRWLAYRHYEEKKKDEEKKEEPAEERAAEGKTRRRKGRRRTRNSVPPS